MLHYKLEHITCKQHYKTVTVTRNTTNSNTLSAHHRRRC